MTLMGKIFTVLILIMSVMFMCFSIAVYATHRNWKTVVDNPSPGPGEKLGLKQQYQQLRETNTQLRAELERVKTSLEAEQVARRHALASLQTKVEQYDEQVQQREAQLANLQANEGKTVAALQTAQNTVANVTKEVEGLRNEIRQAQQARDEAFSQVVSLTDEVNQAEDRLRMLQEREQQLALQVSSMKNVLSRHGLDENTPVDNLPPFDVDGVVRAVSGSDLVEISLGSDDGLRKGHQLEVYRDKSYLGRVIVMQTEPDKAVARIIPEFRKGTIKKGDRVATKLS